MVISKIVMCITAMKPYSGPECLIGKVALVIGGSTGMFLLLLFKFLSIINHFINPFSRLEIFCTLGFSPTLQFIIKLHTTNI